MAVWLHETTPYQIDIIAHIIRPFSGSIIIFYSMSPEGQVPTLYIIMSCKCLAAAYCNFWLLHDHRQPPATHFMPMAAIICIGYNPLDPLDASGSMAIQCYMSHVQEV